MNIFKINKLLGEVQLRLESLDPANLDEGIQTLKPGPHGRSISMANSRLKFLASKLTNGQKAHHKIKALGSKRR